MFEGVGTGGNGRGGAVGTRSTRLEVSASLADRRGTHGTRTAGRRGKPGGGAGVEGGGADLDAAPVEVRWGEMRLVVATAVIAAAAIAAVSVCCIYLVALYCGVS